MRRATYRRYALVGGAVAVTAAVAYHAYQSDAYGRTKRYLIRLKSILEKYSDAMSMGGDMCVSLLRDLQQFLQSDGNEVPASLRQLSKLLQSEEVTSTTSRTVEALYRGLAGPSSQPGHPSQQQPSVVDKVLDALLSDRGHSLVSVAVSMGAKNMVAAYIEANARVNGSGGADQGPDVTDKLLTFLSTPAGQQLAVMGVAAFASNGMRIYMDKSLDVNFYEDLFSSMAKPRHLEAVKQCVSVFARDVVGAYLNNGQAPDMRPAPAAADGVERCRQEVAALRVSTVVDADGAVSLAPSPTGSADGGPPEIEAIGVPRHVQLHDDLDSDSLLHSTRAIAAAKRKRSQGNIGGVGPSYQWIAAFGKEWINVSKDPAGRQAIVSVVGSATREAVAAVSSTVTEKYSNAFLLAVLLAGVVSAVLLQVMLRAVGGMLVGT